MSNKIKNVINKISNQVEKKTVDGMEASPDLKKFLGTYYKIGGYIRPFEKGLSDISYSYKKIRRGRIKIIISGIFNGEKRSKKVIMRLESNSWDGTFTAKKFPLARKEVRVLAADFGKEGYLVIGDEFFKEFAILSRTAEMNDKLYKDLVDFGISLGFKRRKIKTVDRLQS